MFNSVKTFLTTLAVLEILAGFCCAQESAAPGIKNTNGSDAGNSSASNGEPAAYYASLNRREIEVKTQSDLLNQLAQEHRKRAEEAARDESVKAQWEGELAKELSDRSAALLGLLNDVRKEQVKVKQAHPELAAPALTWTAAFATHNPDEAVFLGKLEERLTAVQREIADALEAGNAYTAQLQTTTSSDFSRIAVLLQENGRLVRQLQKEASDLELRKLEFRALRKD